MEWPGLQVSNGFAGQPSDGLVQLDGPNRKITNPTTDATGGNLAQTVGVNLPEDSNGAFTLALGFGQNAASAVQAARDSLSDRSFRETAREFNAAWQEYDESLVAPPKALSGVPTNGSGGWEKLV